MGAVGDRRSILATLEPPPVPPPPTADEDLVTKPAAQVAYRNAYSSAYGPAMPIERAYRVNAQQYRDLYYRLHAEVDRPLDRVRQAVTDGGSDHAVLVRTSDHGDLLGAHGGLHQKWYNLYDEATRVPFQIARIGGRATSATGIEDMATCHVDVVPTLLSAAGIDGPAVEAELAERFSEVHPLPGRDLMGVVDGVEPPDRDRVVYMLTRDAMLEGDTGASGVARARGMTENPPAPLRIQLPAHVGTNVEGLVTTLVEADVTGGADHRWKLVRTFDDPATWTEPHVRHLAATGPGGRAYRTEPLPDQWELYDLTDDPIEAVNRWDAPRRSPSSTTCAARWPSSDSGSCPSATSRGPTHRPRVRSARSARPRRRPADCARYCSGSGCIPTTMRPSGSTWPVAVRCASPPTTASSSSGNGPGCSAQRDDRSVLRRSSMRHGGRRGQPRGRHDPRRPAVAQTVRSGLAADDRLLADRGMQDDMATHSPSSATWTGSTYDLVYLAGGWGAAFDFATSEPLRRAVRGRPRRWVIGGVCHGPLGLVNATTPTGAPLVEGRRVTAVTDKQVHELKIESTPFHPETELRAGARFESTTRFRDPFANHWVVDGNLVTGQNQNAGPMVARAMMTLLARREATDD